MKGELRLLDGTAISSKNDLGNGAGGVFRLRTETGVFPSDAQTANSLFTSAFNTLPGKDTVFTVYALDGNGHITRTESRMYDGREWVVPKLFMDGDLIALGTIKGDRLVAGTEIYSPVIKSGLVEAATIRSNAFPPAFELLPDGTLNARKANITGAVNATSGLFQNVVIDESCTVKRLSAESIVGDIVRSYAMGIGTNIHVPAMPFNRNVTWQIIVASGTYSSSGTAILNGTGVGTVAASRYVYDIWTGTAAVGIFIPTTSTGIASATIPANTAVNIGLTGSIGERGAVSALAIVTKA